MTQSLARESANIDMNPEITDLGINMPNPSTSTDAEPMQEYSVVKRLINCEATAFLGGAPLVDAEAFFAAAGVTLPANIVRAANAGLEEPPAVFIKMGADDAASVSQAMYDMKQLQFVIAPEATTADGDPVDNALVAWDDDKPMGMVLAFPQGSSMDQVRGIFQQQVRRWGNHALVIVAKTNTIEDIESVDDTEIETMWVVRMRPSGQILGLEEVAS